MKLILAVFIYFASSCQLATAVVGATSDSDEKLTRPDNRHEQSKTFTNNSKENILPASTLGRMLYENHCTSCHESQVHIRERRKATNYRELGHLVNQRADWLNLGWTELEKQEVMKYLNERYYRYITPD